MRTPRNSLKGKRRITFSTMAPKARKVSLVADFNQWQPETHPMKKGKHGQWSRIVFLAPGEYDYKFWIDGVWTIDERNPKKRRNHFGTRNSIIQVDAK